MTLFPIIQRELSVAARGRAFHRIRLLGVIVGIGLLAWLLLIGVAGLSTGQQGPALFRGIAMVVFHFCLLAGPLLTADTISSEKREGTLGLLFLTDLRGHDVIGGKLVAASVAAAYTVLGLLPVLGVAVMLGGVTLGDVAREGAVWFATLYVSASAGILISTLSRDDRKSMSAAAIVAAAIGYGAYAPAALLESFELKPFADFVAIFSAAYAHTSAMEWMSGVRGGTEMTACLLFLVLLGTSFLAAAAHFLPQVTGERARSRRRLQLEAALHRWSFGDETTRAARRKRLLDENPFLWLSSRHQRKRAYMWLFIGSMLVIWCWMTWGIHGLASEWRFNGFIILGLHALIKFWWLSEVAERFVEDRRNGAVELIFTTPATPAEFATGQAKALRRTFGGPIAGLVVLELLWVVLSYSANDSMGENFLRGFEIAVLWAVLALDLWALKWLGLWNALIKPSAQRASQAAFNSIALWPWLVLLAASTAGWFFIQNFSTAWLNEAMVSSGFIQLYAVVSLGMGALSGWRARRRFLAAFRVVASEGFNPQAAGAALAVTPVTRIEVKPAVPSPATRDHRPWIRRHWVLTATAVFTLLLGGVLVAHRWYWKSQVEARLAMLRSAGIPASLVEFQASIPVLTNNAGTRLLLDAAAAVAPVNYRPLDSPQWAGQMPAANSPARRDWQQLVATNDAALRAFEAAADLGSARLSIDIGSPWMVATVNNLPTAGRLFNIAAAKALLQAEDGNVHDAYVTAIRMFRFGNLIAQQPSQYNRSPLHACRIISLGVLESLLSRQPVPEDLRARLEAALRTGEQSTDVMRTIHGIQALAIATREPEQRAKSGLGILGMVTMVGRGAGTVAAASVQGFWDVTGLADRDMVTALDQFSRLIMAATASDTKGYQEAQAIITEPDRPGMFSLGYQSWMAENAANVYQGDRQLAMRLRAARLAIAADAYRQRMQRWPAGLKGLAPPGQPDEEWLNITTSEPFTIEPLPNGSGIEIRLVPASTEPAQNRRRRNRFEGPNSFVIERTAPAGR